ncbi:hypothetical protein G5B38_09655 [Pseudohalocynthiibacter aestuariivivens]|uniref:Uncharacterized protein n=1 Tax=Roseovarius pelagicus TaxID=2980108 RepID=A0ABY6D9P4_9RHOB|nr:MULTISPECIES: hypothetical protein [Rhodobacterales]QIE45767.1 hypothetical protein G5B38_09655 [Pseudohalocynthiibacter aestuariivivens]UXX82305.1 hypothetical protein N7U68_14520 [Roseovarius pelagicus]
MPRQKESRQDKILKIRVQSPVNVGAADADQPFPQVNRLVKLAIRSSPLQLIFFLDSDFAEKES